MPYALLADIHGNLPALEAVLEELDGFGIREGIVLGDVAQGGDEPAAVLDRLAELAWPVILGNADHFLLEVPTETNEEIREDQLARRAWSLTQLEPRHLEQILSRQLGRREAASADLQVGRLLRSSIPG